MNNSPATRSYLDFPSIDDLLGDSRTRFFGAGFRQVRHALLDVVVDTRARSANALAKIEYPKAWSTKKVGELRAHLSTLDALSLAAQLCEAYLRTAYGLDDRDAARMWLARVTLKSGSVPTLNLDEVPVSAQLLETHATPESLCGHRSSLTLHVGSIGVDLLIDHPVLSIRELAARWSDVSELSGPAEQQYYGAAYKADRIDTHDVVFSAAGDRVCARVDIEAPADNPPLRGLGAAYAPFVSPTQMIVCIAQLAQALLYRYDDITREVSHNLWMRKVVIHSRAPAPSGPGLCAETWSTKMNLLPIKETTWRTGTFAAAMPGMTAEYNIAHQLPGSVSELSARALQSAVPNVPDRTHSIP